MKKTLSLLLLSSALVAFNTNAVAFSDSEEDDDLVGLSQQTEVPTVESDKEREGNTDAPTVDAEEDGDEEYVGPGDSRVTKEDLSAIVKIIPDALPVVKDAIGTVKDLLDGDDKDDEQGSTTSGPGNDKLDTGDLPAIRKVVPTLVGVAKDVVTNVGSVVVGAAGNVADIAEDAFEWLFGSSDDEEEAPNIQGGTPVESDTETNAEDETETPVEGDEEADT